MYLYVPVHTSWYIQVQDGTSQYRISSFRYRTVQLSTRFPVAVQDDTGRYYKTVEQVSTGFLRSCTGLHDGTSQYRISSVTIRTRRYSTVQVSTRNFTFVHISTYWYVHTCMY